MNKIITHIFLAFLLMTGVVNAQSHLWGTTTIGGATGKGTIFITDGDGTNLHPVYSLIDSLGALPTGAMILPGNGKFYGVTIEGGCSDSCVIFTYDPVTGVFVDIHDFACTSQYGEGAFSALTLASDGKLYGLCNTGGANSKGVIYRVDTATNVYTDIFDFIDSTGFGALGTLIEINDGTLYGASYSGGINNAGVLFSYTIADSSYSRLYSFTNATGVNPGYDGLMKATDGNIYGMTFQGGAHSLGVIFKYDLLTNIYTDVYDFDSVHGASPYATGLIQATNGLLYGLTYAGGIYNDGVLFSFDISNNSYTDLFNFDTLTGIIPQRSLIQASNGLLFGTTYLGGTTNQGVFFSYNIGTSTYTDLFNFDNGSNGGFPLSNLIEIPDSLTTGIKPIPNKEAISIYPNPAATTLTINNLPLTINDLRITDVLGNEVYHQAINNSTQSTINIRQWSDGVYFYQLTNNKETYRGKFIKE